MRENVHDWQKIVDNDEANNMNKSEDKVLFVCTKIFWWNWDAFQIVREHFKDVQLITWDGDRDELKKNREKIKSLSYDYLISFGNIYFFLENEFKAAKKGAINFHPAPSEHPGLGMFSYIFAFPEKRMHHGTTVHEVNEKLDNGQIYQSTRFPCYGMSPEELGRCSIMDSLQLLEEVCLKLKRGDNTSSLKNEAEDLKWNEHFFTHKQELNWLAKLPKCHIAHRAESFLLASNTNSNYFAQHENRFDEY
jgi:Formyl transferase